MRQAATPSTARFRGKIIPYASKASPEVAQAMVASASALGFDFVSGITAATPGFYGPSSRVVDGLANTVKSIKTRLAALQTHGYRVVNMEMESSLLFHVAAHLGCAVGTVCPVISKPTAATAIADYSTSVDNAISVALHAMSGLHEASAGRQNH